MRSAPYERLFCSRVNKLFQLLGHVEGGWLLHRCIILPRLLCATASRSEGTCSDSGASSALRRQICTAKAPWELQREREREDKITLGGLHPVTHQKDRSPFELCCFSLLLQPYLRLSSLPPFCSYGAPWKIPRPSMLAGPSLPPAQAGSPWKSIAGYCWNNNHSNRSCKYLWDGNVGPLCQPKFFFSRGRSCSWRVIPPCLTLTGIVCFNLNVMAFFHPTTISASVSLGCVVIDVNAAVLGVNTGGILTISDMMRTKVTEDWHKCILYRLEMASVYHQPAGKHDMK